MIKRRFSDIDELNAKAEKALKAAIRKLVREHRRFGQPLLIWQKGRVVKF